MIDFKRYESVERKNDAIIVRMKYKTGDNFRFLLSSDHHYDSKMCRRDILKRDLDSANKHNAGIFMFGDLFDVMQNREDPRRAYSALAEAYKEDNYLDLVREDGSKFYQNYKENSILISEGNHESNVTRRQGTNLIQNLVQNMNLAEPDTEDVFAGQYNGWVFFRFENESGGGRFTIKMYFNHGQGGSAPVTRGVIRASRRGLVIPDAQIVVTGHTHEKWYFPITRERVSANGVPYYDEQIHLQLPSYKRDDGPNKKKRSGWAVEKGFSPKPLGAWWLDFSFDKMKGIRPTITTTPTF